MRKHFGNRVWANRTWAIAWYDPGNRGTGAVRAARKAEDVRRRPEAHAVTFRAGATHLIQCSAAALRPRVAAPPLRPLFARTTTSTAYTRRGGGRTEPALGRRPCLAAARRAPLIIGVGHGRRAPSGRSVLGQISPARVAAARRLKVGYVEGRSAPARCDGKSPKGADNLSRPHYGNPQSVNTLSAEIPQPSYSWVCPGTLIGLWVGQYGHPGKLTTRDVVGPTQPHVPSGQAHVA
jgi:hypothetical protein